jgi:hypothetical protein
MIPPAACAPVNGTLAAMTSAASPSRRNTSILTPS